MTKKELEQRIVKLEKRIKLLETVVEKNRTKGRNAYGIVDAEMDSLLEGIDRGI